MSGTRVCDTCGKTFFGTTNRRAARPLDPKALAAANAKIEANCSRLDGPSGKARPITMRGDDYLCRRVWMDAYLEALQDEPEKTVPKDKMAPEDPCFRCQAGKVGPTVACTAVEIVVMCSHTGSGIRSVLAGGVLAVVPSSNYGADEIKLEAKMQKPCGAHPVWSVTGEADRQGDKYGFPARPNVTSKLWIPSFNPRVYPVTCTTCAGTRTAAVHVYPPTELSSAVDFKKSLEIVRKITKRLESVLDTVADNFQWKYLEGKGSIQASWKEYSDHRAYYAYDISVKLDPLFGAEFKVTIGPGKVTKLAGKIPGIGKYIKKVVDWLVKAGLYFKTSGGLTVDVTYKRDKPEQPKFVHATGAGIGGQFGAAIGAEGAVVGDLLKVELEAGGAVKASGSPFVNETGFGLGKFEATFDGLKGNCKLLFMWGVVDVNETVTFVGPEPLYGPTDFYFYEA